MAAQRQSDQRLVELETELKQLRSDVGVLRLENIGLKDENVKLQQSLDEAKKSNRSQ